MRPGKCNIVSLLYILYINDLRIDRCGISRIWVSPLHRRQKIATYLLRAVQVHTILGTKIPCDLIAFSAPTDDGRALARHFTQNDNFLTYSQ